MLFLVSLQTIFRMHMRLKTYFKNSVPSWGPVLLTQRSVTIALKTLYTTAFSAPGV